MVGESPLSVTVNSAPSLPEMMVPAVVFQTLSEIPAEKSKEWVVPRAISVGQSAVGAGISCEPRVEGNMRLTAV